LLIDNTTQGATILETLLNWGKLLAIIIAGSFLSMIIIFVAVYLFLWGCVNYLNRLNAGPPDDDPNDPDRAFLIYLNEYKPDLPPKHDVLFKKAS